MKVAFDTSVLVAGLVEDDPEHARAVSWLTTDDTMERVAHGHAYAETWSVLTALPIELRVCGEVAAPVLASEIA